VIIRRALVTDVFELSRLWKGFALESSSELKPNLQMWRDYITGLMNYQGYLMFVAEVDDEIVGFIDYVIQPEPGKGVWIAIINFFYVLPEFRNTEVSGKLWKACIESARENKIQEFSSICFPSRLEFWKKHGFEQQTFGIRKVI
jgi:GNAT superfamily N-acetyltransferase